MADLSNAAVWMASTCPLISQSSNPFIKPLGIFPSASIIIAITITFMFHIFLVLRQVLYTYVSFHCLLFSLWGPLRQQNSLYSKFTFFFSFLLLLLFFTLALGLGFLLESVDVFISQNPWEFHVSDSPGRILVCAWKVKLATVLDGNPKAPFSTATTARFRRGHYFFP